MLFQESYISFAPRQIPMAQVSHRGALDVDEFCVTGSKQTRQQGDMLQLIHTRLPKPCHHNARASQIVYVPLRLRSNATTRTSSRTRPWTSSRGHLCKVVQSATHQNNLDLVLAFREHGNFLSLVLCFLTDTTTNRQSVIVFQPRDTIPLNQHSLPTA